MKILMLPKCGYSGLLAGFSSSNITICSESCIAFYDNSTGTPTVWQWSFPAHRLLSSTLQNPTISVIQIQDIMM